MGLSGHCLCGAVKYTVDAEPLIVGYDHCDDCQRQSGSTYSLVVVVPKDKLTITGTTKSYAGKGSSGNAVHRVFCPECGSPIAHDPDAAPPIIALKGGTLSLEDKKKLKPVSGYHPPPCLFVSFGLFLQTGRVGGGVLLMGRGGWEDEMRDE